MGRFWFNVGMLNKTIQILESLKSCKGCERAAIWHTPIKKLKGDFNGAHSVSKQVTAHVRAGIDFANLSSVKSGIESGERGEVESLPWGEWLQFPFVIGHTRKDGQYCEYVRLYPPVLKARNSPKRNTVQWYLDSKPVDYSAVEPMLLAADKPKDETPECFNLNVENIVAIQDVG